jgi:hypothetical protein
LVIDFWVNALSKEAAAAFLGKSGFGSVEGFFGVDVKQGMTPLDLVAEMGRVGVDRGVLSTSLSTVDDDTLDHPFLPMERALQAARSLALDEGPMADFLGGTAERLLEPRHHG